MSEHRFNQAWLGCCMSASKSGAVWYHHHAVNEPCPLNLDKPWGVTWRAADHTEGNDER